MLRVLACAPRALRARPCALRSGCAVTRWCVPPPSPPSTTQRSVHSLRGSTPAASTTQSASPAASVSGAPVEGGDAAAWPTFAAVGVPSHVLGKVETYLKLHTATPVQAAAVGVIATAVAPCPAAASKYDVVVHAHTGSGKTLAYLLPLVASIDPARRQLRYVIVAPTRELSHQITAVAEALCKVSRKKAAVGSAGVQVQRVVGEVSQATLYQLRHSPPHILIGTPTTLARLLPEHINCGEVMGVVLDEADECVRTHAVTAVSAVVKSMTKNAHRPALIAVSATPSPALSTFLSTHARNGSLRKVDLTGGRLAIPPHIAHMCLRVGGEVGAYPALTRALAALKPRAALVFHNSAASMEAAELFLRSKNIRVAVLGNAYANAQRAAALDAMHTGRATVLLATEMAARGLHLPRLTHVINFDLPHNAREYVHRAGRVGRLGGAGKAVGQGSVVSFVSSDAQRDAMHSIASACAVPMKELRLEAGVAYVDGKPLPGSAAPREEEEEAAAAAAAEAAEHATLSDRAPTA